MILSSSSVAGVRFLAAIKYGQGLKPSAREAGIGKAVGPAVSSAVSSASHSYAVARSLISVRGALRSGAVRCTLPRSAARVTITQKSTEVTVVTTSPLIVLSFALASASPTALSAKITQLFTM